MHFWNGFYVFFLAIVLVSARPPVVVNENDIDDMIMETDNEVVTICQPQTPCAWKIFNYIEYPEITFINDYCVCRPGTKCETHVNRHDNGYVEYRCKKTTHSNSVRRKLNIN